MSPIEESEYIINQRKRLREAWSDVTWRNVWLELATLLPTVFESNRDFLQETLYTSYLKRGISDPQVDAIFSQIRGYFSNP